jgi:hypothetical protein
LTNCSQVLLRLPPFPLSLFFSLPYPTALAGHVPSTSCPAPLSSVPRVAQAPASPLPTPRWPSPRCSTSRRRRPSLHVCRRLASSNSRPLCLFLDLKYILELPTDSPSTAASAASHPRSIALAASPRPTESRKPAQFRSPALDHPDHYASELELPLPLSLAVVPTIYCLLAPSKCTISTTSSRRSSLVTSPPPSGTPATGTPTPPLGAPPSVSVHCRPAVSALLFPNTGHPCDRRELLNLSPHFPLTGIWTPLIGIPV